MLPRIARSLYLAYLTLLAGVSGFLLYHLSIGFWWGVGGLPLFHGLAMLGVLWLLDSRLLLLAIAVLIPLHLSNETFRVHAILLDVPVLMIIFGDALLRLRLELMPPGPAEEGDRIDRFVGGPPPTHRPPWPLSLRLAAGLLVLVALAAALYPAMLYPAEFERLPEAPGLSTVGYFIPAVLYDYRSGMSLGIRLFFYTLTGVALMDYCYRRCDAVWARRFVLAGGAGCLALAVLGIADYFDILSLRHYRAGLEELSYIHGTRRLMSLARHSGWLAQYFVLTWPFVLLLIPEGTRPRRWPALMAGVVALAVLLTLQRAAWLTLGFLLALMFFRWTLRHRHQWARVLRQSWPMLALLAGLLVLGLGLAEWKSAGALSQRVGTLLRYADRLNYVFTTATMLRVSPTGVGLGMHHYVYQSLFLPDDPYYQIDHATAHNLWLQAAAEQGPAAAFALLLLPATLLWVGWRSRLSLPPPERRLGLALSMALGGIFFYGIFQELFYLRALELHIFITAGLLMAVCWPAMHSESASVTPSPGAAMRWRLVRATGWLVVGLAAVVTAWGQARFYRNVFPELAPLDGDRGWIAANWRAALPRSAEGLDFLAMLHERDQEKTLMVQMDSQRAQLSVLRPGQTIPVRVDLPQDDSPRGLFRHRILRARVSSTMPERRANPEGAFRSLGAYLFELKLRLPDADATADPPGATEAK